MAREAFTSAYIQTAADLLVRTRGISREEAVAFCKKTANQRFRDPMATTQHIPSPGNLVIRNIGLCELVEQHRDDVLAPSGSIYTAEHKHKSIVSTMVEEQMAERKRWKAKMFEAEANGDTAGRDMWNLRQATIKIMMNSLPGGFGSAYNVFYDKGGYNTITSFGRTVISTAYTLAEQLLGGVFALFGENEVLRHLSNILQYKPTDNEIMDVIKEFKLIVPSKNMLLTFLYETVNQYQKVGYTMPLVEEMVERMSTTDVCYAYYYCNLKHILQGNDRITRQWMDECLNLENIVPNPSVDKSQCFDSDIVSFVTPLINERLGGKNPYELLKESSTHSVWFASVIAQTRKNLDHWLPVFNTFVFRDCGIPNRNSTKRCVRRSVIISDTDSVIYTVKQWTEWYTHELTVTPDAYGVALFMTYWLNKTYAHALHKLSERMGASKERLGTLVMKNEFLYPSLILFDIKKMYAGIVAIKEGLILKEPETDIKGVQLKSSNTAKETSDFIERFIADDILKASMAGKLNPQKLIAKLLDFENTIRKSLQQGEMTYCKIDSLDFENAYKDPMGVSQYVSWVFWCEVFQAKYGEIHPPGKYPSVPLVNMTNEEKANYAIRYPDTWKAMQSFYVKHKKVPNFIMVNPFCRTIPEELQPLIDTRAILYHNMKPAFLLMEQLNLGIGFEKNRLLYGDVYASRPVN